MTDKTNKPQKDQKRPLNAYARYSGIAIQMFAIIAIGTYVGVKLDEYYPNKNNLFSVFLSLAAVILSIIFVIRQILLASKEENN